MHLIVALCLVASAVAGSVDWSSLETRAHHVAAVEAAKVCSCLAGLKISFAFSANSIQLTIISTEKPSC